VIGMSRKAVDLRREEMLRATIRQIEAGGIDALRIADVARVLGVSSSLIVYHFQTKEKLVAAAFSYAAERDLNKLAQLTIGPAPVTERLMAALHWYGPTGRAQGWRLWIDAWSAGLRDAELERTSRDLDRRWKAALGELIQDGTAAGLFHAADSFESAGRITALLDGMAVQAVVHRGVLTRRRLTEWMIRQVAWELGVDAETLRAAGARKPRR
jgi:AcrR family transcriptional regulator